MRVIPQISRLSDSEPAPGARRNCGATEWDCSGDRADRTRAKSSTLAAILDPSIEIRPYHILTIEDPIEFMHRHKNSIIHQRELHSDTPNFALALRAALRQAPKSFWSAKCAIRKPSKSPSKPPRPDTWSSRLCTRSMLSKTVERIVGVFPWPSSTRSANRLAKSFRFIVSQRLLPRKDGNGRVATIEILKATLRTREYLEKGEAEGKTLLEAMQARRHRRHAVF